MPRQEGTAPALTVVEGAHFPWWWCILLLGVYLLVRLPHLRAMPVFCDEATYLRWAQLVAQNPWQNLFISMEDAKLPLHYWLLALARPFFSDAVYGGRVLSVMIGAATLPVITALCGELVRLVKPAARGRGVRLMAPLAAALFVFNPMIAFYQRMALAEPLLLMETCAMAWLALRFARHVVEGTRLRSDVLVLGGCWSAALITKQNFSYLLWFMPWVAIGVWMSRAGWRGQVRRFVAHYAIVTLMGLAVFVPVLFTSTAFDLRTRLFYKPIFTTNFVYHSRAQMIWQNLVSLCSPRVSNLAHWWPHDAAAPLEQGLLYVYLTPPVFALALGGIVWAAHRRMSRVAWFMAAWCVLLMGTLVAGANLLFSRYLVAGVAGLILWAAWIAADVLSTLWSGKGAARICAGCAAVLLLAWPAATTIAGAIDFRAPIYAREDRSQYLSEASCGSAAEDAVRWLKEQGREGPITVITGDGLDVKDDFAWLELRQEPNVHLFCQRDWPRLQAVTGRATTFRLKREQWVPAPQEEILLPPEYPIYMLVAGVRDGTTGIMEYAAPDSPGIAARRSRHFSNPPITPLVPAMNSVAVYRLEPILRAGTESVQKQRE